MLYAILKIIFKISLRIFFRKIEVRNPHFIPPEGPLLIAANHPNTFMDPLAIAAITRQEVYFIAKSTIFKSPLHKWLLGKMNLVPIFRREDGLVPAQANDNTFRRCFELLHQKSTLLIFPEGNSYNERRLRPLKTGTARMALGAETGPGLPAGTRIVPVGLNYSDPTRFRSSLFINVGSPIVVADFVGQYQDDPLKASQSLTDTLRQRLEELLVITSSAEEDELVQQIEAIYKYDLLQDLGLTRRQEDKFVMTKAIADSIRYFNQHDPNRVRTLQDQLQAYIRQLDRLGLQDKFLRANDQAPGLGANIRTTLYLFFGLPVYLFGALTNYIPYIIPAKITDKLVEEQEFRAPVMMTVGIFSFLIFYSLEIGLAYRWSGSWGWTVLAGALMPVTGLFALQYFYQWVNTRSYLKLRSAFYRRQELVQQVLQERAALIKNLEEAKRVYIKELAATLPENQPGKTS
jgi:glycerol-3-phosphate O-acyltransferase / dihydroxyacetone phosphate acyltransferase